MASKDGDEMSLAYKMSQVVIRERIGDNPENLKLVDSIKANDIVVVNGVYDKIDKVLQGLNIPFTQIDSFQLVGMELNPQQIVYINCTNDFPVESAKILEKFVFNGGMLITTDWALKHVIEVAFPNTIVHNGVKTDDDSVAVEIVDRNDEILKGFIDQDEDAKTVWWLESCSYPIDILDSSKVKVLVKSNELKTKYGADPVIISFTHGKGTVYHMISHFYLQRGESRTQKQGLGAMVYVQSQKLSDQAKGKIMEISKDSNVKYAMAQSAATSSEFIVRSALKHRKQFIMTTARFAKQ